MDKSPDAVNHGVMTASMMMRAEPQHRQSRASHRSPDRRFAAVAILLPERRR
jgi:hypothetical protein